MNASVPIIDQPGERVSVLSPHLDDAALSIGAAIANWSRSGIDVRIVTVLAGDPDACESAGKWDRLAGFETAGEAARARAREDERACEILGATPVHLPFGDRQYGRFASDDAIWEAIAAAIGGSGLLLVPGAPLAHEDHAWLAALVRSRELGDTRLGFYLEQPYALWSRSLTDVLGSLDDAWIRVPATQSDRRAKVESCRAYVSQLPGLGGVGTLLRLVAAEARRGGEALAFLTASETRRARPQLATSALRRK